jgi:hypothetical protein
MARLSLNKNKTDLQLQNNPNNCKMDVLQQVDWKKFSTLCLSLGNQLNSPQWRFLKAIVLEKGLEAYSNGLLEYVGEERNGCDFTPLHILNADPTGLASLNVLWQPLLCH